MTAADEIITGAREKTGQVLDAAETHRLAVVEEADRLRVRAAAAQVVRQERAGPTGSPVPQRFDEFLAVADDPVRYRVADLWPVGGRVVLAAQYKAGKSTLLANLIRALADGDEFLGHAVDPVPGRVVLIDDELDERMLRRWLRDQGIARPERVVVVPLRGKVVSLDLIDPETRTRWAALLREHDAGVLILDCLRPILDALGLSEDKDAGRFLVAFDALLAEAEIGEAVVSHHMGHTGERSRGDTRLRDWPDVEWRLVRETTEGEQAPDARRFFSAYGRDVDSPEALLGYDAATRRLAVSGGSRTTEKLRPVADAVVEALAASPGLSQRGISEHLRDEHPRDAVRSAIHGLCRDGVIRVAEGARRSQLHYLIERGGADESRPETSVRGSARQCAETSEIECASGPLGATAHSVPDEPVREGQGAAHSLDRPGAPEWIEQAVAELTAPGDPTTCDRCGSELPDAGSRCDQCPDAA